MTSESKVIQDNLRAIFFTENKLAKNPIIGPLVNITV
jgi:hypothetical protein